MSKFQYLIYTKTINVQSSDRYSIFWPTQQWYLCSQTKLGQRNFMSSAIFYIVNIGITLFDGQLMGVYVHAKVVRFHLAWNSGQLAVNHHSWLTSDMCHLISYICDYLCEAQRTMTEVHCSGYNTMVSIQQALLKKI